MTAPNFSPLALDILRDRYLWRDANGETIETPEQMLRRVANHVASAEPDEADRKKYAEEFYEIMARLDFLPNSPTLMNAGRPAPHGQLSACFVVGIEDDMQSICDALRKQMLIHKTGGGTGFNFSKLRPKNSTVNSTNGRASGPVSFMRLFDLSTEVIQQGGMRRGANMAILNADHSDIEEFISCKDEEGKITNFNLSVGITDAFMDYAVNLPDSPEAVLLRKIAAHAWKSGDPGIVLLDAMNRDNPVPQLGRIEGTNPCLAGHTRILTDEGYRRIDECVGEKVNVWNGKEWSSVIPRITGHNQPMRMIYFEEDVYSGDIFFPIRIECTEYHKFKRADGTMVTAADLKPGDKLFPYDLPCVPSETGDGEDARTGWGVTVLRNEPCMKNADTVYCLTEPKEHMFIAEGILVGNCGESPLLSGESCNLGSINLAHMVTPHRTFDWGRLRDTVIIATRFLDDVIDVNQYPLPEIEEAVKRTRKIGLGVMGWADLLYRLRIPYDSEEAVKLARDIMEHIQTLSHIQSWELGLRKGVPEACKHLHHRNATLTCVAPTGTLALLADCSSGIEPVFSLSHTRRITLGDGTIKEVEVVNPHYAELCADTSLSDEDIASIAKTAYQIPWNWHVAHQAAFQRYTDLAVSKTVNLPADATVEDVLAVYVEAWRQNCKGVTVYRNGSRSSQVLTDNGMPEVKCTTC